jgi:broad specificity phosphatase PhoE
MSHFENTSPDSEQKDSSETNNVFHSFTLCPKNTKSKLIHFVRHAEGEHNIAGKVPGGYLREEFEDAILAPSGQAQCLALANEKALLQSMAGAQLLVTSPMRRTIQTASESFPHLIGKIPWLAIECIRETTGLHPCDRRLPVSINSKTYPHVDFSLVEHDNDPLYHLYNTREPTADVTRRCIEFMTWLQTRSESEIIVVTHSAYLNTLFTSVVGVPHQEYQKFENCEIRSCVFHFPIV